MLPSPGHDNVTATERRSHPRRHVNSIVYVNLGGENGGVLLDVSEGGIAVQAAIALTDDHLPAVRFQLWHAGTQIEAVGDIVWRGNSRKTAGIRFADLPDDVRAELRAWVADPAQVEKSVSTATKRAPVSQIRPLPAKEIRSTPADMNLDEEPTDRSVAPRPSQTRQVPLEVPLELNSSVKALSSTLGS